ncbi:DNA-binding transcriptional regulator, AcrR family [Actinokineospora alba]|uniref:DNA-binding transcriptional regulator, AcrR family n=1 Tax=Actinokineospora alba TaxID=504798 RepID=A0A1H0H9R7_9PSEU|nr:TetR/AcrR family transcriptional regulator [Actinokineospora alba]TDP64982.1 TetR family transcriptional regulator [Actinokineospora alba]SDH51028.1 DNA-binding transcriptional regulator, AcrR family [Actinokineospora alba]SDO15661.1 DNA-binding transcriptional regulator, AcrR family [Actinokineospora alba]
MPKLWSETIEEHRRSVRDATLDTTAALVARHGLAGVTMSQVAKETGIGRATLYKYFPSVESILLAWHERQVTDHLAHLAVIRDRAGEDPGKRLAAVLEAYAVINHHRSLHGRQPHGAEFAEFLHAGSRVASGHARLRTMIADLLRAAADSGDVRADVSPDELASFCLHALNAATEAPAKAAARRLVTVTLDALRPR